LCIILKTDAIAHAHPSDCLNCGSAVHANFCAHCGQDTVVHMPSAFEFLHEFVGHYVALENKLLKTLALLLFKPGRLTRDYLEGKRVRYVLPLRLYLTLSLVFFAIVKWEAHDISWHSNDDQASGFRPAVVQPKVSQKDLDQAKADLEDAKKRAGAAGAAAIAVGQKALDQAQAHKADDAAQDDGHTIMSLDKDGRDWVHTHFSPKIAEKIVRFAKRPNEEKLNEAQAALFEFGPYAIFAMMPVFALYLKLLYLGSGRLYGEHLLFALHTNAFAFLVLILLMLVPKWIPFSHAALWLWLTFYLPTAMRKVYGGSRLATWVRWMVLMVLHLVGMVVAVLGALAMAVVA
jgi:hypothetical protein